MDRLGAPGKLVHMDRLAVQGMCASPALGEMAPPPTSVSVCPFIGKGCR